MPFLNNAIVTLNQQLIAQALCFVPSGSIAAYGICETMLKVVDADGAESTMRYPAVIDDDGEATMVDIDDVHSIIFYHRLDTIQNSTVRQSFGDGQGDFLETANLTLTLFAFRDKVRKTVWEIEAIIKDRFPNNRITLTDQASGTWLQSSVFRVGNTSFDKLTILQKEYTSVALNYPNVMAMQMGYRIESTWKRGCLNIC